MLRKRFMMVLITAFMLRAVFLMAVGTNPGMYVNPDSSGYLRLAENMVTRFSFSSSESSPFEPETFRTPGYPAFLTLFHFTQTSKILLIVLTQALLGSLTAGFLYLTGHFLWRKSGSAGFTAGTMMAFDYVVILYSSIVLTETVFTLFLVLCMLFFARFLDDPCARSQSLVVSGLLSGVCSLIRPVSLYYFVVLFFVLLSAGRTRGMKKPIRLLLVFLFASLVIPSLWVTRNKQVTGAWTFTTIQGVIRAAILEERLSKKSYEEAAALVEAKFKREHPDKFSSAAEEASAKSLWAMKYVLAHPKDYTVVLFQEALRLLAGNGMKAGAWMLFQDPAYDPFTIEVHPMESNQTQARSLSTRHPGLGIFMVVYLSLLGLVYLLTLTGVWVSWREDKTAAVWLALTAAYFFLVSIGFGTGARSRIPLMPAIFLLAGYGMEKTLLSIKGLQRNSSGQTT